MSINTNKTDYVNIGGSANNLTMGTMATKINKKSYMRLENFPCEGPYNCFKFLLFHFYSSRNKGNKNYDNWQTHWSPEDVMGSQWNVG